MKNNKVDESLIRRYTQGRYSFKELKLISDWFSDFRFHAQIRSTIENHWHEFEVDEDFKEKDLSAVFNRLKKQILAERKQLSIRKKVTKAYLKIAAIIALPLLLYSVYSTIERISESQNEAWAEIVSPLASRTHFELPDGSKVVLNGNSSFKYQPNFKKNRHIQLKGEAYFDVIPNPKSPFVVETALMDIKVLGTKFSVADLESEKSVDVILEDGKVQLIGKNNSFVQTLKPNEGFFFDKKLRSGEIRSVDAPTLTSWKDEILMFRDEPLGEVLKRIGRSYNVTFDVQNPAILDFTYRATFRNESLEELLRLIALTAPIKFEIKNRNLKSDDIYGEKTIIIKLK